MDEFKKVHRKMFQSVEENKEAENEIKQKLEVSVLSHLIIIKPSIA